MKPLAILKSCWSAVQNGSRILFRVLGLNLIVAGVKALRHASVGKGYDEPIKTAIRQSRKTALLRALIHVAPVSVALWEVVLNWNTYYVGATIRNLAYYQIGAKVHEIAAQASLAATVFTYIRYELALGQGLPFGALFSGLQISQASYLWSMEFWGTACSKHLPIRRRIGVIFVVSISISLAATIGPSSAILLIPRLAYWPAGSTDIWLNATFQDIWPDRTNGSLVSTDCLIWDPLIYHVDCPSVDWQSIQRSLELTSNSIPKNDQFHGPSIPAEVEVTGRSSLRHLTISTELVTNIGKQIELYFEGMIATSQQVAVADALTTTGILWSLSMPYVSTTGHGSVLNQLDAVHSIAGGYYQPYTSVVCVSDMIRGPDDTNLLAFPAYTGPLNVQPEIAATPFFPNPFLKKSNLTKSDLFKTPGSPGDYRLRWVELPFNETAIGAIIFKPQSPQNTSQELLVCSIGAGWGLSTMNTSTIYGSAEPVLSQVDTNSLFPTFPENNLTNLPGTSLSEMLGNERQTLFSPPIFPQRPVMVTEEWAKYLNPSIRCLNTTIFNTLMGLNITSYSPRSQEVQAEMILAEMVANGLSRIGSTSQLQGTVKEIIKPDQSIDFDGNYWFAGKGNNVFQVDPLQAKDWVKFRVSSTVEGYAYNTQGTTTKLAIGFLLAYCLIAIAHIIYAGISGISSTCWDSIGEVTALAMNSTPTAALRNTCAGITELNIFKLPVRVLAFRDAEGDGEHLELVFGNLDEKTLESRTIKANRAYGTMPNMKAHDKVA